LTTKGRAHLERVKAMMKALDDRWTARLTAQERATLTALLDKVGPPPAG
jgi:DNA-binding MarR family transcriptional regulator